MVKYFVERSFLLLSSQQAMENGRLQLQAYGTIMQPTERTIVFQ